MTLLVGMKVGIAFMENDMEIPQQNKKWNPPFLVNTASESEINRGERYLLPSIVTLESTMPIFMQMVESNMAYLCAHTLAHQNVTEPQSLGSNNIFNKRGRIKGC